MRSTVDIYEQHGILAAASAKSSRTTLLCTGLPFDQELDCNQPHEKKADGYEGSTFTETAKPYRDVAV